MGQAFRKLFDRFFGLVEMRVAMLGLDAAGKTTILYKLHIGEVLSTVPTIGFNVEKVQYKNVVFTVWDVGGQEKLRPLWRHYFSNTDALIYVVDSLDRERIGKAKEEFQTIIRDPFMLNSVILVFANKQDLESGTHFAEFSAAGSTASNLEEESRTTDPILSSSMTAGKIIGVVVATSVFSYVCDTLVSDKKIFGGTTPKTVSDKRWYEETDKKFQAWPRTAGPPVVMNPISRQNFIVKSSES